MTTITYKMLADAVVSPTSIDTVRGTDLMFTDGEASGAIAKIMTPTAVVYVWSNGRTWSRDLGAAMGMSAWIAGLAAAAAGGATKTSSHSADTKTGAATQKADV
jgi:hypothetical protein